MGVPHKKCELFIDKLNQIHMLLEYLFIAPLLKLFDEKVERKCFGPRPLELG